MANLTEIYELAKKLNLQNLARGCETMTEQQKAGLAKYDDSVNEMYGFLEQEVMFWDTACACSCIRSVYSPSRV